mmetsp:Transcript_42794/g.76774  ORF Transcript_42794/g.76774 Transcript_42794/m.76774 type:complete len:373 (-) Transcript_42794:202-1320(-)
MTQIHCPSQLDQRNVQKQRKKAKGAHKKNSTKEKSKVCLPDLTQILIDAGLHEHYLAWQKGYIRWRKGQSHGAKGDLSQQSFIQGENLLEWCDLASEQMLQSLLRLKSQITPKCRESDHSGIVGHRSCSPGREVALQDCQGALREATCKALQSVQQPIAKTLSQHVFDVASDEHGELMLIPVDGPKFAGMCLEEFAPDALVSIRVFRFFEHRADEKQVWEQELRNVNSGSLTWLPAHLAPGLHSTHGAKYGKWFTVHTVQVLAKHFKSAYFMCEEGCNILAKSFGCTPAQKWTIDNDPLETGYFWFVSPASADGSSTSEDQHLNSWGWRHVSSEGPFHGEAFLEEWQKQGSRMATHDLQAVLEQVRSQSHNK